MALSEEFFQCFQLALKLSPDELSSHYTLVENLLKSKGMAPQTAAETVDFQALVKKCVALLNSEMELLGWEMALLAGEILQNGNFSGAPIPAESFESRGITGELRRYDNRSIANVTSVMDTLKEKGFAEETDNAREKGAHRSYRINTRGHAEVMKIWKRAELDQGVA